MNDRQPLSNVTAVLSMLHEQPAVNSTTRLFRAHPVLAWTLQRLTRAQRLGTMTILCWEDQLDEVRPIAQEEGAHVLAKGPRQSIGSVQAIATAQRWADGWRGGLLNTCDFDQGFHAPWVAEIAQKLDAAAVILVDPASALVDPQLIDALIARAARNHDLEMVFAPAAPGLAGLLLRPPMLQRLAASSVHAGKLLHYLPDAPAHDPCSGEGCLPIPTPVARSLHRFKLDSHRQITRISRATISLNGQLISNPAEELVARMSASEQLDDLPRHITLELTTRRNTNPIFSLLEHKGVTTHLSAENKGVTTHLSAASPPAAAPVRERKGVTTHLSATSPPAAPPLRPDLPLALAESLFQQLAAAGADDVRLTLAGLGDPLLHPQLFDILNAAARHGLPAIHIETDLLGLPAQTIDRLAQSPIDILSVHLPAVTESTYRAIMGVDAFQQVLLNIRRFLQSHKQMSHSSLLVPTFVKCRQNLAEMEPWYDQWLRTLGCAVITGPSDYGGLIPNHSVADMSPPLRRPCARLNSRLTILSTGQVVSCEEDLLARQPIGTLDTQPLTDIWRKAFAPLRADHAQGNWNQHPVCKTCRQWHRP